MTGLLRERGQRLGDLHQAGAGQARAPDDLAAVVEESNFRQLAIGFEHAAVAGALPRHHDDPFDRMLVAQARQEGLIVVTADPRMARSGVSVLAAELEG